MSSLAGMYWLYSDDAFYRSMLESWKLPAWIQLMLDVIAGSIFLVTGIFMLKGRRWAWMLVIALLLFQIVLYVLTSPYIRSSAWLMTSAHLLFYGVYLYLLLSEPACRYFGQTDSGQ
ncbi:MAG: hypothetical protein U5P41_12015 [Gammaproteobacteria bacterium]|nr:hypothetical protein [Gammaproteobacteria bacterium]